MNQIIKIAFVGNPNCGKTTLFNAVTGSKLKVANWPGVTVEKTEGERTYQDFQLIITDTPGIYSMTCYTIEEKVTRKCVMDDEIDVIINVVDASNLERNLYLTLQLLELGKPVILALNMMDIVEERGIEIDLHRLPEMLGGIPVIPVSATKKKGLDTLLHAAVHHYEEGPIGNIVTYPHDIEEKIEKLEIMMGVRYPTHELLRWHAIKLLEYDDEVMAEHPIQISNIVEKSYEKQIIESKYKRIEAIVSEVMLRKEKREASTDRIDAVLTHPIWGVPVFLCIMAIVFLLTFTVGDALKGVFELFLERFSMITAQFLRTIGTNEFLVSLIVDGIIAGVGGILTFLPNIIILFLSLAILEDSGYMSRVAYVMDGIMGKLGLSGKAFLPMVLGFGCTVPAIMATRALEKERDRRRTIMVTPFMSCSARLPIYVLFSGMFFHKYKVIVAFSMYVIGLMTAILVAMVVNKIDKKKQKQSLLIELPEYKRPNAHTIFIYVWEKVKDYLTKAGTTIFLASIVIWLILNLGPTGVAANPSESIGAKMGQFLVPVFALAGFGTWQIVVALIAGISAKEVVVSSLAVLYGVVNANSQAGMQALSESMPGFGPLNAYALMIFCLFYTPCIATIATIKKETKSIKFTLEMVLFQLLFAWGAATLVYQIGSLI